MTLKQRVERLEKVYTQQSLRCRDRFGKMKRAFRSLEKADAELLRLAKELGALRQEYQDSKRRKRGASGATV